MTMESALVGPGGPDGVGGGGEGPGGEGPGRGGAGDGGVGDGCGPVYTPNIAFPTPTAVQLALWSYT